MSKILKFNKNESLKKKNIRIGIALLVLLAIAIVTYAIFEKSGHWLVEDDEFKHVKWVAVLDGQSADLERSDYAANLLREGKVDSVLLLGRRTLRDRSNSEFYVEDFMKQGAFDNNVVFLVPHDDPSTISEARTLIPWLKKHNADTVLLITDAASTFRAKRMFQKLSGNSPVYLTTDIHHVTYNPSCWYSSRESRKDWLRSWAALFASYFETFNTDTLTAADSSYYRPIKSYADYKREVRANVNMQKLLPKLEDKINSNSEKESVKESSTEKTQKAEPQKTESKEVKKEPSKDTNKATAKEQTKAKESAKDAKKDPPKAANSAKPQAPAKAKK
ncbi:MAG: YdcF family protein [Fibrobacter sp.]|nr:YdcF family protein [Fibrobacter sp.]